MTHGSRYRAALQQRHDVFAAHGCRLSDHGNETFFADDFTSERVQSAFARVRSGAAPTPADSAMLKSAFLHEGAVMDHAAGWTQQFHYGPLRNASTRIFRQLGPDAGCDSIGAPG